MEDQAMLLDIDVKRLTAFLETNEDCSRLSDTEYIADLYDAPRPLTLDLFVTGDEARLAAAAYLEFDEELDGWYMGELAEDAGEILAALRSAMDRHE